MALACWAPSPAPRTSGGTALLLRPPAAGGRDDGRGDWRDLHGGAIAVSIVYAGIMSALIAVEIRGIILSRFDIFELAKASAISNALVRVSAPKEFEDVFARQGYLVLRATARFAT